MARKFVRPSRKVGNKGEAIFADWCADEGISAVRSSPDVNGWDYFVEFAPEIDVSCPRDHQKSLVKALVQVKATDKKRKSVPAKLSALQKLVDADMPAFIVHIAYSHNRMPISAMILHIGNKQTELILENVRRLENKGRVDFHNITIYLGLDDAKKINLAGTNIGEIIYEFIPENGEDYVVQKAMHRKTCGYDERSISAKFKLSPEINTEQYVDFMLGEIPSLPIENFEIRKKRFGIEYLKDLVVGTAGYLTVDIKPFQKAKIIAVDQSGRRRASMDLDAYGPAIPNLPKNLRKLRFTNEFLDFDYNVSSRKGTMALSIAYDKRFDVTKVSEVLKFGGIMAMPGASFELQIDQSKPSREKFPAAAAKFKDWNIYHEYVEVFATAIFKHKRSQQFDTNWHEITKGIDDFGDMLAALTRPGASVEVHSHERPNDKFPVRSAFYIPIFMKLGELTYTAVVRAESTVSYAKDDAMIFTGGKPYVVEDDLYDGTEDVTLEILNDRASELAQLEGQPTVWTIRVQWKLNKLVADV
jgi:hypothetical protein